MFYTSLCRGYCYTVELFDSPQLSKLDVAYPNYKNYHPPTYMVVPMNENDIVIFSRKYTSLSTTSVLTNRHREAR